MPGDAPLRPGGQIGRVFDGGRIPGLCSANGNFSFEPGKKGRHEKNNAMQSVRWRDFLRRFKARAYPFCPTFKRLESAREPRLIIANASKFTFYKAFTGSRRRFKSSGTTLAKLI